MMNLRSSFETKVLAAFTVAVLVVAMLAAGTWKVSGDAFAAARRMSQTHEVLDVLSKARIATLLSETSTRGFLISGDAALLAERDVAISAREALLRQIKALTAGDAMQQQRCTQLSEVVETRVLMSSRAALLRETEGFEAARAYSMSAPVLENRARVYRVLAELEHEERDSLAQRSAEQTRTRTFAVATSSLAALALVVLLVATFVLLRRQMRATEASRSALGESEQNLSITLQSIGDAVLATDTEQRITRMNPVAERLTGWSFTEAQGQAIDDVFRIIHEHTRAPALVPVATVLATGQIQALTNHTVLIARDGTEWPIADSAAPIRDNQGRVSGVVLVFRDVTDERRAERAIREQNDLLEQRIGERTAQLHQSEARLQAVFEQLAEGVLVFDLDGHPLHVNRAAIEMLGFTKRDDYLSSMRTFTDIVELTSLDGTIVPADRWPLARILRDETLRDLEMHVRCLRNGSQSVCCYGGELVRDADNQPLLAVVTMRDITERKRAELEIRELNTSLERRVAERTQQLEEASRAKSEFLANMSHELRTPLNAIIGFSEMLKDGLLGSLDTKQRGFVTDIFGAGTHLLALINDILDLSKVEAGMMQLETDAVDVAALLQASTLVVREAALAQRIRLDTALDPRLGTMLADERKLKQIAYNLLSNAVKFASGGGAVKLHARRCTRAEVVLDRTRPMRLIALPPGDDSEFLEIIVEDSGHGIAEQDLGKLFEPFTQLDNSAARRQGGTGLGLSLVRRLAELHGGTVGVASRIGGGSRFYVWLPYRATTRAVLAQVTARADPAPVAPAMPLALVVEDDDRTAELITAQLHAEGFAVIRTATAEEGLVCAAKRKPQLITLDIFLPAMDGWEFMRRLKGDPALADTPVVIITVSDERGHSIALGARRVLHKPFARDELAAALAGVAGAQPGGSPMRVLVVDDNVAAVELMARTLQVEGYQVLRAYGGAEAIEVARSMRPTAVILDLMMPDVSGFEVARALRESQHTASIPIVVFTAKDLTVEDRARLGGDVSAILAKASFSHNELLTELRRALPARGAH
jgi:PAS domain S-box-containing protein